LWHVYNFFACGECRDVKKYYYWKWFEKLICHISHISNKVDPLCRNHLVWVCKSGRAKASLHNSFTGSLSSSILARVHCNYKLHVPNLQGVQYLIFGVLEWLIGI
jgi:hypothetical protein